MIGSRHNTALWLALIVSFLVHIVVMFCVRQRVMSHGMGDVVHSRARGCVRMVQPSKAQNMVAVDEVADIAPAREAPVAELSANMPAVGSPLEVSDRPVVPGLEITDEMLPKPDLEAPEFKLELLTADNAFAPVVRIPDQKVIPQSGVPDVVLHALPVATMPPAMSNDLVLCMAAQERVPKVVEKATNHHRAADFKPSQEVYAEVDARVVEEEKLAVRELLDAADAKELSEFVELDLKVAEIDGWTYFLLSVMPKASLAIVPKDLVLLVDASGSIGSDRMGSIRGAGKHLLRVLTNTGDRFNLVAFRDRYSYAFSAWQECTSQSFAAADAWFNRIAPHGRTDVFSTISSVLTLPRDPARPIIALVVTDGEANTGVYNTAEILSRFSELNDGLISVYMYGVKSTANRELIDVLTHGNRGEGYVFEGWRWQAGSELEKIALRFRDPVLSDLRLVFASGCAAETYPRRLKNLYSGEALEIVGRIPSGNQELAFSLKGLNGGRAHEGFLRIPLARAQRDEGILARWRREKALDQKVVGQ